jgi:hypothetical protein
MSRTRVKTSLDLRRVVFDGDARLRSALSALERIASEPPPAPEGELSIDVLSPAAVDARAALLKSSFRLTRGLAPSVWRAVDRCTRVLGIKQPIELYVQASPESNAFVLPPEKGRVVMGITSRAIETLDEQELVSVIGHELGHVVFDHHGMTRLLELEGDVRVAPADAMRLYAWLRYAELTADRVGLLCCDDLDACISAEFKMVSGLTSPAHVGDLREVSHQFTALSTEKLEESELDWLATHPYAPLRIRALDLFSRSTTYHALQGRTGGEIGERELEGEIEGIMELMNPSCLDEKAPHRDEVREFLALAGIAVALSDRRLDDLEVATLSRLVGEGRLLPMLDGDLRRSRKARNARIDVLATRLREHLSLLRRRKILEDLCAIALADNQVAESEVATLMSLAGMLHVDPYDVDAALGRAQEPLD